MPRRCDLAEGALWAVFDVANHALDVYCLYKVTQLLQSGTGIRAFKPALAIGGVAVWGVVRTITFAKTATDGFFEDSGGFFLPCALGCCQGN